MSGRPEEVEQSTLRRFLFGRQHLAEPSGSVPDTFAAVFNVYGTGRSLYPSLAARTDSGVRDVADDLLFEQRTLVRLRAMRSTVYTVPVEVLADVFSATRPNVERIARRFVAATKLSEPAVESVAGEVLDSFDDGERLAVSELAARVDPEGRLPSSAVRHVVTLLCSQGRLVRAEARGVWTSDSYTYAPTTNWLGADMPETPDRATARRNLLELYLVAYGPVSLDDFRWWSGLGKREAAAAWDDVADSTGEISAGELGVLCALGDDVEQLAAGAIEPAADWVRLLPVWDTLAMGYRDRRRLVPEHLDDFCYDRSNNATAMIVGADGVLGVWEFDRRDDDTGIEIRVAGFADGPKLEVAPIRDEAERIGRHLGFEVTVEFADRYAANLRKAKQSAFLSPIRLTEPS